MRMLSMYLCECVDINNRDQRLVKREQKQEWEANTVYSLYITLPLPACILNDCREGREVIYRENTVLASHSCFCSFFTSHPYILSKYLQNVIIITVMSDNIFLNSVYNMHTRF